MLRVNIVTMQNVYFLAFLMVLGKAGLGKNINQVEFKRIQPAKLIKLLEH